MQTWLVYRVLVWDERGRGHRPALVLPETGLTQPHGMGPMPESNEPFLRTTWECAAHPLFGGGVLKALQVAMIVYQSAIVPSKPSFSLR